jgi:glycosyltransferase involved in cell wall biosynthesis
MLIAKMSNALLFYTDEEVTQFRRGPGSSDQRPIGALNNGLNVEEIRNWAAPYSASDRPKHILLIGRLTDKAEITLLLDALSHDSCQEVVLEVVGGGPMTQELQTQAASQGLASRVVWHGGITDEAVIARVANRCRAFVYPGQVGLSLIHAMAYGLPSIIKSGGRANGPETAAFTPQETGLSFAGGNARDLAQTISTLINDEERLNSMARKAYSVTDASFNTKDMVRRFKEFIDAI